MASRSSVVVAVTLMLVAGSASAARLRQPRLYPLQFSPLGTVLYVAGYTVDPTTGVTGECDYKHSHSGSGRGGGYKIYTDYYQGACSWDLFGNLTSESFTTTTSAPVPNPPAPLAVNGNQITYDSDAQGDSTGQTTTTSGFVMHSSSDYAWTAAAQITTDTFTPISFQASLTSTGDLNLHVSSVDVYTATGQSVTVLDDGCVGHAIQPGQTCTITLDYDPNGLVSELPTVVDTVHVDLTTNSGLSHPFTQSIEVTGVQD